MKIQKVRYEVKEDVISDLKERLERTRFPDEDRKLLDSNSVNLLS